MLNDHHVYPLNDLRPHETDGKPCWCKPSTEYTDGGAIIVHNSMDRREMYEELEKPLSESKGDRE